MKNYISFRNSNPGSWEGVKSEASTKLGIMDEDGSNLRYLDLEKMGVEGQTTWAPSGKIVIDGKKKMVLTSSEGGMCHLATTRLNIWTYDFETEEIKQIYNKKEDRADFISLVYQFDENRFMFFERIEYNICKYYICDLDGGNSEEIEFVLPAGYLYTPRVTPDKKHFIIQHSSPYAFWTCDIKGGQCELLVADPGYHCFGIGISPDSKWVSFTSFPDGEPMHEWANANIVNIETKERTQLTNDKSYWLSAMHGDETVKGGGSNIMRTTPFGNNVTLVKGLKNSKSPWKEDTSGKADNHFNKVYDKSIARGGTGISIMDVYTKKEVEITKAIEGNWDFRPEWSPESHNLLFVRAKTGGKASLWMADKNGSNQRLITSGYKDVGIDHPMWI